jgi:serine phosphatase RsbU (regulator of sigma subunit)/integral membrane sensor domain MASE1/anti-sigma regulatory factor (Ser/Thr protein kinase)
LPGKGRFQRIGVLLFVGVAYYLAARVSLRLALVERNVTPLWPPTGIAVVAFYGLGRRAWPAVAAAAFFVNAPISRSLLAALITAAGNTAAPALAAYLLRRVGFRLELDRRRDAVSLVLLGALASMLVSATIGSAVLVASGAVPGHRFLSSWSVWWAGDAMGVLAVAPFLWSLVALRRVSTVDWRRVAEATALLTALVAASWLTLRSDTPRLFVVLPLLGWIAWRFEQPGAAPAALVVSGIAVWAATHDLGPFADGSLTGRMLTLQSFNASVALCSLVFAAIVSEHRRASEALVRARTGLEDVLRREHKVAETLQRSFLPEHLPDLDGVSLAARYVSGSQDVEVGGDWYDAVALDRRLAVVVGDVEGRGVQAAAAMGQLRNALRTFAFEGLGPGDALNRLNRLVDDIGECEFATVVFAELWLETGELRLANAGHPPPLLALPDGTTRYVEAGLAVPIAASGAAPFPEASLVLEPGSTLLLYTDGLIERRDASLDQGLARLATEVAQGPAELDPLLDRLLDRLGGDDRPDDIAMLGLRLLTGPARSLRLQLRAEPAVVPELRRRLRRFLERLGLTTDEVEEIVLASCEAAANAIQHPVAPSRPTFDVVAVADGAEVVITVRDSGRWRTPDRGHERGRGLDLMASLMELHVQRGRDGTEVRMSRRLD